MSAKPAQTDNEARSVKVLELVEEYAFKHLFRVMRARFQFRQFNGEMSAPITRINFERGDSVGVLLFDAAAQEVILVRQFRFPVYASLDRTALTGEGVRKAWMLEIVAGIKHGDQTVSEIGHQELLEEAGVAVIGELQPIATIYPSPGASSERIHVLLGQVDPGVRVGKGGGVLAEGEDIQAVVLPFREAMDMIANGEITDAKTIIALQHLALIQANVTGDPST